MLRQSPGRSALHPLRLVLLSLAAMLAAACAGLDGTATAPVSRAALDESGAAAEPEVIINDEEWIDRTAEEGPWWEEPASEGASGIMAAALAAEPRVRVGIVNAELNATSLRMGGADASDTYELRGGTAAGPVLASGLTTEVVASIVGSGAAARIRVALGGTTLLESPDPVVVVSASGLVRLRRTTGDSSVYRGTAEARFNAARTRVVGVNELPIEQYLYGVVPRELGPLAFPYLEAQKTQAVAARTYARRRLQFCPVARCSNGYHLIPTTADQVYGGYKDAAGRAGEFALSNQAVDETRGTVATYNGGLIDGLYSSSSGGFTANSEDVFANPFPYLRGVPDHERGAALEHVPTLEVFQRHGNPTNLRNHANGDFEADWTIFHRWYVEWTAEEMRQVVGRVQLPSGATFVDPGQVYAIEVVSRGSSGRVLELRIATEKRGTLTVRKDAVRTALRYVTYTKPAPPAVPQMVLNSLRSTLVYVEPVVDRQTQAIVGWEAWGGGWGHGVGMSQTGAVGMAEKGRSFREILTHYYQGIALEQRWE